MRARKPDVAAEVTRLQSNKSSTPPLHCRGGVFNLKTAAEFGKIDVKFTDYFQAMRQRPDRAVIRLEWIEHVINHPEKEMIQADGRIRRWAAISEMDERQLRVILLPDGETVHNAFFDRRFKP
jgi:hypothetical protein